MESDIQDRVDVLLSSTVDPCGSLIFVYVQVYMSLIFTCVYCRDHDDPYLNLGNTGISHRYMHVCTRVNKHMEALACCCIWL